MVICSPPWPGPALWFRLPLASLPLSWHLQMRQMPKPGSRGGAGLCPHHPRRRPPRPRTPGTASGRLVLALLPPAQTPVPLARQMKCRIPCALGLLRPSEGTHQPFQFLGRDFPPGAVPGLVGPLAAQFSSRAPLDPVSFQPQPSVGEAVSTRLHGEPCGSPVPPSYSSTSVSRGLVFPGQLWLSSALSLGHTAAEAFSPWVPQATA